MGEGTACAKAPVERCTVNTSDPHKPLGVELRGRGPWRKRGMERQWVREPTKCSLPAGPAGQQPSLKESKTHLPSNTTFNPPWLSPPGDQTRASSFPGHVATRSWGRTPQGSGPLLPALPGTAAGRPPLCLALGDPLPELRAHQCQWLGTGTIAFNSAFPQLIRPVGPDPTRHVFLIPSLPVLC